MVGVGDFLCWYQIISSEHFKILNLPARDLNTWKFIFNLLIELSEFRLSKKKVKTAKGDQVLHYPVPQLGCQS